MTFPVFQFSGFDDSRLQKNFWQSQITTLKM